VIKYLAVLLLIPLMVTCFSLAIAYFYNPPITHTTIYFIRGGARYLASTVSPGGSPVFIYISQDHSQLLSQYTSTEAYTYYLLIRSVQRSTLPSIEKVELALFTSNSPVPHYAGSIEWSAASKIIGFIEKNKVLLADIALWGEQQVPLDSLKDRYVYLAVIAYLDPDTTLSSASRHYVLQDPLGSMKVSDAVEEDLGGNYTIASVLNDVKEAVLFDISRAYTIDVSIISRISVKSNVLLRLSIGLLLVLTVMFYDYRRNPESYAFLRRFFRGSA